MRTMLFAVLVLGMVAPVAFGADLVDNPEYKHWASYKPGTTRKLEATTESPGDIVPPDVLALVLTDTLREVTGEKVVIEMEAGGRTFTLHPNQMREIAAKVTKEEATKPTGSPGVQKATKKGEGDEEITVGGKKYKCHWTEYQTSFKGDEGTLKTWTTDQVPGGLVKAVKDSTKFKSKTTTVLVEFKAAR